LRSKPIRIGAEAAELVTLSIGVASASPASQAKRDYQALAERLISEADSALYRAKSGGRNQVASSQNIIV
jgi:PleD family two-component response regulator